MKLQRREKILAAVTAGLVLALGVWLLFFSGSRLSHNQLAVGCRQLEAELNEKEARLEAAAAAARRLGEWQRRALPANVSDARTTYQAWLRQLADRCKFQQLNVDSTGGKSRQDIYTLLAFSLRGQTKLDKLVEFLHDFYASGHLHQIRRFDLKPVKNSSKLDVGISVEAMSLPRADRKSELAEKPSQGPLPFKLADYRKTITKRNLFGPHRPSQVDPAKTTFVTAIVEADGRREVWLSNRNTGQQWTLHANDAFQVGTLQGNVQSIAAREAIIELDEKRRCYACGDNLRGGRDVQKRKQKTQEEKTESSDGKR